MVSIVYPEMVNVVNHWELQEIPIPSRPVLDDTLACAIRRYNLQGPLTAGSWSQSRLAFCGPARAANDGGYCQARRSMKAKWSFSRVPTSEYAWSACYLVLFISLILMPIIIAVCHYPILL